MAPNVITFSGHDMLRHRLILGTLSGNTIKITDIRPDDSEIGVSKAEI